MTTLLDLDWILMFKVNPFNPHSWLGEHDETHSYPFLNLENVDKLVEQYVNSLNYSKNFLKVSFFKSPNKLVAIFITNFDR